MKVEPVTLQGRYVRLEPLSLDHGPALLEVAQHEDIWRFMSISQPRTLSDMQKFVETALEQQGTGWRLPFAIIELANGRVIGSTSYLEIQPANRGLEIGWTWLGRAFWRSPCNTECKYLLLGHAFDELGAIRVQIKTDSRNNISQRAIERIGGVREGVLRRHMIYYNGYVRDTVYYSILDREWPGVKDNLEIKMANYSSPAVK